MFRLALSLMNSMARLTRALPEAIWCVESRSAIPIAGISLNFERIMRPDMSRESSCAAQNPSFSKSGRTLDSDGRVSPQRYSSSSTLKTDTRDGTSMPAE